MNTKIKFIRGPSQRFNSQSKFLSMLGAYSRDGFTLSKKANNFKIISYYFNNITEIVSILVESNPKKRILSFEPQPYVPGYIPALSLHFHLDPPKKHGALPSFNVNFKHTFCSPDTL